MQKIVRNNLSPAWQSIPYEWVQGWMVVDDKETDDDANEHVTIRLLEVVEQPPGETASSLSSTVLKFPKDKVDTDILRANHTQKVAIIIMT